MAEESLSRFYSGSYINLSQVDRHTVPFEQRTGVWGALHTGNSRKAYRTGEETDSCLEFKQHSFPYLWKPIDTTDSYRKSLIKTVDRGVTIRNWHLRDWVTVSSTAAWILEHVPSENWINRIYGLCQDVDIAKTRRRNQRYQGYEPRNSVESRAHSLGLCFLFKHHRGSYRDEEYSKLPGLNSSCSRVVICPFYENTFGFDRKIKLKTRYFVDSQEYHDYVKPGNSISTIAPHFSLPAIYSQTQEGNYSPVEFAGTLLRFLALEEDSVTFNQVWCDTFGVDYKLTLYRL